MIKAKCYNCLKTWDLKLKNIHVEPDGHDLRVVAYCPYCHKITSAYNPNDLIHFISPEYVDYKKEHYSLCLGIIFDFF